MQLTDICVVKAALYLFGGTRYLSSGFRRRTEHDPVVFGRDIDGQCRRRQVGRKEQTEPGELDRLVAALGGVGEGRSEIAARADGKPDADLGGIHAPRLERAFQHLDRSLGYVRRHGGMLTEPEG